MQKMQNRKVADALILCGKRYSPGSHQNICQSENFIGSVMNKKRRLLHLPLRINYWMIFLSTVLLEPSILNEENMKEQVLYVPNF